MEFKTISDTENALFNRREIEGELHAEVSPSREEVRKIISETFSASEDSIKIRTIKGKFGQKIFLIVANIYKSKEDMDKIELKKKKDAESEKRIAEKKQAEVIEDSKAAEVIEEKTEEQSVAPEQTEEKTEEIQEDKKEVSEEVEEIKQEETKDDTGENHK